MRVWPGGGARLAALGQQGTRAAVAGMAVGLATTGASGGSGGTGDSGVFGSLPSSGTTKLRQAPQPAVSPSSSAGRRLFGSQQHEVAAGSGRSPRSSCAQHAAGVLPIGSQPHRCHAKPAGNSRAGSKAISRSAVRTGMREPNSLGPVPSDAKWGARLVAG